MSTRQQREFDRVMNQRPTPVLDWLHGQGWAQTIIAWILVGMIAAAFVFVLHTVKLGFEEGGSSPLITITIGRAKS